MVESEAQELSEDIMLKALEYGHQSFQPLITMIEKLKENAGKLPWSHPLLPDNIEVLRTHITKIAEEDLRNAYELSQKQERYSAIHQIKLKTKEILAAEIFNENILTGCLKN